MGQSEGGVQPIRVAFVCHGNICRSPLAEYLFRDLARRQGCSDRFAAASLALSDEEIYRGVGNPVYPPIAALLAARGIDCSEKRACRMTAADYDRYDRLIGMEQRHVQRMRSLCGGDPTGKIARLLDFTDVPGDIADPWYTRDFQRTLEQVERGCEALFRTLLRENGSVL